MEQKFIFKVFVQSMLLTLLLFLHILPSYSQRVAVKSNFLFWATTTPNLGLEAGLSKKVTFELKGSYNPFTFSDGKKLKHWLVQPELRWWGCEKFNGTFIGVHALGGEYSMASLELPFGMFKSLKDHRYEGYFYGGGINFGNHWIIGKRWGVEAGLGIGYIHIQYDKYKCVDCSPIIKTGYVNYFGVTSANVSIVYFIR